MADLSRLKQLEGFLEKEPNDPFLQYAIAIEYDGFGESLKALELLNALYSSNPNYSATYYHLGRLLNQEGKRDEALKIFELGIVLTKSKREQHLLAELQSAYTNLLYDE